MKEGVLFANVGETYTMRGLRIKPSPVAKRTKRPLPPQLVRLILESGELVDDAVQYIAREMDVMLEKSNP